jgi:hypothetical protein
MKHILSRAGALALALPLVVAGCSKPEASKPTAPATSTAPAAAQPAPKYDQVPRLRFNTVAAELFLPLFWVEDRDQDKALSADELAVLWGYGKSERGAWVVDGKLGPAFDTAYAAIVRTASVGHSAEGLSDEERARRALVVKELQQGRTTLVAHDFAQASAEDKAILTHVMRAVEQVEALHAKQKGVLGLDAQIPEGDTASRMMFWRNQGPGCEAPATMGEAACYALSAKAPEVVGVYPAAVQAEKDFCKVLEKKGGKAFLDHYSVLVEEGGKYKAVPYAEAYKAEMEPIATELEAAAAAIQSADEAAFKAYLTAAAKAFRDNSWQAADEAWAAMSVKNSKWYLRIGPDESYWEPCNQRAGFHASFARINTGSLEWQNKLDPLKEDMENALAALAGKPYKARKVSFHLPDFLDIIVNAGDSRSPSGATIGQSLPNWGPVANEGRGRTVVMVNLYTDADSNGALRAQAASLLCAPTMGLFSDDPSAQVMSTVLHEAAHNLGPAHEYKANGKTDDESFGGPMAATMEELKAQTAALYFTDWLVEKGVIDAERAAKTHVRDLIWAFGHISRGMYTSTGDPKPYSQLASIQLGHFMQEKVISWKADEKAANGEDTGCFEVDVNAYAPSAKKLMATVAGIKARGDKKGAEALKAQFVDAKDELPKLRDVIAERMLRSPKATFVYTLGL